MEAQKSIIPLKPSLAAWFLSFLGFVVAYLLFKSHLRKSVKRGDSHVHEKRSSQRIVVDASCIPSELHHVENVSQAASQEPPLAFDCRPSHRNLTLRRRDLKSPSPTRQVDQVPKLLLTWDSARPSQSVSHQQQDDVSPPKSVEQVRMPEDRPLMSHTTQPCDEYQKYIFSLSAKHNASEFPFFQLPCEVRNIIYHIFVQRDSNKIAITSRAVQDSFKRRKLSLPVGRNSSKASRTLPQRSWGSMTKSNCLPYLNGLAQTCRLAYQESSHILYRKNHFSFSSAHMLREFIVRSSWSHVQAIQGMIVASLSYEYASRRHICLRRLGYIQPFTNLKMLWLNECWDVLLADDSREYARGLMIWLVKVGNTMELLQKIVITSTEETANMPRRSRLGMDFQQIPDWVHSYTSKPDAMYPTTEVHLTDTLERVYRPLHPARCGKTFQDCATCVEEEKTLSQSKLQAIARGSRYKRRRSGDME